MSTRRYIIAVLIGSVVGLAAVATAAEFLYDDHLQLLDPGKWSIPGWDSRQDFTPGSRLNLVHQAIALRMLHLLIDQGFAFLCVPVLLAIWYARVDEMKALNQRIRAFANSMKLSICLSVLVCCVLAIANSEMPSSFEGLAFHLWHNFLFFFVLSWLTGIAPGLWLVAFLVIIARSEMKPNEQRPV